MDAIRNMLEMNQIIEKLKEFTVTEQAASRFDQLKPMFDERELKERLRETTEARKLMDIYGTPPIGGAKGLEEIVCSAVQGGMLSIDELETMRQFSAMIMRLIRYLKRSEEQEFSISGYGRGMVEITLVQEEIERCIRNGTVDDSASKELKEIRRKIAFVNQGIRQKLESLLKNKKECFSESFISSRNGHDTLPVKKEYKFQISGTVIDISSSGATYFMEPSSVSGMKEERNVLQISESNEQRKILYELSGIIADFAHEIKLNLNYLEELDFIFAKAKLSLEMDAVEPRINTERRFHITEGRHPLMPKKQCVPVTISFEEGIRGIVITGPNTGGKTVALKTAGLCSAMAQSGLHIPCKDADLCMNSQILCDLGDGQSISENLSTFSAHIKNIIQIVEKLDSDSLVLLDELGSGTDPTEGMGIAVAILEELITSGCHFIVTTHYPEIKEYAEQTRGMVNARMAFDKESLKPLYQLEIGKAGESCALYIAKRLGMPVHMLNRAGIAVRQKETKGIENSIAQTISSTIPQGQKEEKTVRQPGTIKTAVKIIKDEKQILTEKKEKRFQIGDCVVVYPQKEIGIVFQPDDEKGQVGVQIKKEKEFINQKRIKLKVSALELYPDDYDYSILFDTVENRKLRHKMEKGHIEGKQIKYEDNSTSL